MSYQRRITSERNSNNNARKDNLQLPGFGLNKFDQRRLRNTFWRPEINPIAYNVCRKGNQKFDDITDQLQSLQPSENLQQSEFASNSNTTTTDTSLLEDETVGTTRTSSQSVLPPLYSTSTGTLYDTSITEEDAEEYETSDTDESSSEKTIKFVSSSTGTTAAELQLVEYHTNCSSSQISPIKNNKEFCSPITSYVSNQSAQASSTSTQLSTLQSTTTTEPVHRLSTIYGEPAQASLQTARKYRFHKANKKSPQKTKSLKKVEAHLSSLENSTKTAKNNKDAADIIHLLVDIVDVMRQSSQNSNKNIQKPKYLVTKFNEMYNEPKIKNSKLTKKMSPYQQTETHNTFSPTEKTKKPQPIPRKHRKGKSKQKWSFFYLNQLNFCEDFQMIEHYSNLIMSGPRCSNSKEVNTVTISDWRKVLIQQCRVSTALRVINEYHTQQQELLVSRSQSIHFSITTTTFTKSTDPLLDCLIQELTKTQLDSKYLLMGYQKPVLQSTSVNIQQ